VVTPFVRFSFDFINLAVMPLWFGLLFFPRQRWVPVAIDAFIACAALLFVLNLFPGIGAMFPVLMRPSVENVGVLLSTPQAILGSWTHFIIGDLWIGRWISQDGAAQGLPRPAIVAILVLTLLFGPCGLLAYFLLKLIKKRRFGTAA
jgi:hypothetical protein